MNDNKSRCNISQRGKINFEPVLPDYRECFILKNFDEDSPKHAEDTCD